MAEDNEHIENTENFLSSAKPTTIHAEYSEVTGESPTPGTPADARPDDGPVADAGKPAPRLTVPQGNVADLLEQQVAICAGLIGNVAEFIAGDARPESCYPFMDRIARLMSSSAKEGRIIGQLRGIAAETKQTFVKRKEDGKEGGAA